MKPTVFRGRYGVQLDFRGEDDFVSSFLEKYDLRRLHFITGCGFESRTRVIMEWLANHIDSPVECTVVDLLNKRDPQYKSARRLQVKNMAKIRSITKAAKWRKRLVRSNLYSGKSLAHRPLLRALRSTLSRFNGDFLVDISSLPRSIALSALRILWGAKGTRNLLVGYTEEANVGSLERQARDFGEPSYLPFFYPSLPSTAPSVWFPVLGGDSRPIRKIENRFQFDDIYPIVGFPSTRPVETDEIVRNNSTLLKNRTEKIIFASMNDPFQLSIKLNNAIDEIRSAFGQRTAIVMSPHGSKPQSVGILMTAVSRSASLAYCQPLSYHPMKGGIGPTHLYWLKGTPYGPATGMQK